ncbi:MAG: hypothetical protein ABSF38_04330 [Verrucomicrobiota bacterium]|jgi:uncharacterized protein YceK
MKNPNPMLYLTVIMSALVAGCGEKMSKSTGKDSDTQLTASDLAMLTDFHAWKTSIPEAQQPVKTIRLVILNRRDGTVVTKFSTGANLETNCSSFLLGIRVEQGRFMGHLLIRTADGGGLGWDLHFTDALADSDPAWSAPGTLVWNGNHADLAASTRSNIFDTVLAIELDK